jgi:hypothetical protein
MKLAIWIKPCFIHNLDSPKKTITFKRGEGPINSIERDGWKAGFDSAVDVLGRWMIVGSHYFTKDLQPLGSNLDPVPLADLSESIKFHFRESKCFLVLHVGLFLFRKHSS